MNKAPAFWTTDDGLVWSIVRPLLVTAGAPGLKVSDMVEWVAEGLAAKCYQRAVTEPQLTGYLWRFFKAGIGKRAGCMPGRYILTEAGADAPDVVTFPGAVSA